MATVAKVVHWPDRKLSQLRTRWLQRRLENSGNHAEAFRLIYKLNTWDRVESVSGPGSTIAYTANLRRKLPELFKEHGISAVFDAPCGDFNWMPEVLATSPVHYVGGDIVRPLVAAHQKAFAKERIQFRVFDITRDPFPHADLWICRDCLFHLYYQHILQALSNFVRSKIRFALLTNHCNEDGFRNEDIRSGGFRKLDLFTSPFSFPEIVLCRIQEGSGQHTDHEM